jgi:hypothetical protein
MTTYAERRKARYDEQTILLMIGKQVSKISRKPFKSGEKINTIKSVTQNPQTGNLAFEFNEDESNVECWRCKLVE